MAMKCGVIVAMAGLASAVAALQQRLLEGAELSEPCQIEHGDAGVEGRVIRSDSEQVSVNLFAAMSDLVEEPLRADFCVFLSVSPEEAPATAVLYRYGEIIAQGTGEDEIEVVKGYFDGYCKQHGLNSYALLPVCGHIPEALGADLRERMQSLVRGVEVDLDQALSPDETE